MSYCKEFSLLNFKVNQFPTIHPIQLMSDSYRKSHFTLSRMEANDSSCKMRLLIVTVVSY